MVDTGGSPGSGRRIVALVRGLSAKPVKAVVITHWHGDHPLGLPEVLKAWPGARVIATAATRAHLADPKTMNTPGHPDAAANAAMLERYRAIIPYAAKMQAQAQDAPSRAGWAALGRLFTQYAADMDGALTLQPAEAFDQRLQLPDRSAPAEALFLGRANTDGDALVWLPRQRILITGDVVTAPIPFGYGSYPAEWRAVLARVRAYRFRLLVPGHGASERDRAYLDRLDALLAEVQAQVAPLARQGLPLKEVQAKVTLEDQATAFTGGDPWLRRWFGEYWTKPIVASAYREATGQPIVQSLGG
jgi:glyoxylase-like metal-dependent hydrolase (beta-lactamase superfamily II)